MRTLGVVSGATAALILCGLAYTAGSWGLADLVAIQPRVAFRTWGVQQAIPVAGDIAAVRQALESALRLEPGDPAIKEELGFVHSWAAARRLPDPDAVRNGAAALSYFRAAVRERPVSSYAWVALAAVKWRMQDSDAEFEHALRQASLLGPWEPQVQIAVVDAGLQAWSGLSVATRRSVSAAVERSLRWQDEAVFAIARRHGRLDVVCAAQGVALSRLAYACV